MAKVLMQHPHGAGLLFLANKPMPTDSFWKERTGARTESAVQSVFNAAVSYKTDNTQAEWGSLLKEGFAKKFIRGPAVVHYMEAHDGNKGSDCTREQRCSMRYETKKGKTHLEVLKQNDWDPLCLSA